MRVSVHVTKIPFGNNIVNTKVNEIKTNIFHFFVFPHSTYITKSMCGSFIHIYIRHKLDDDKYTTKATHTFSLTKGKKSEKHIKRWEESKQNIFTIAPTNRKDRDLFFLLFSFFFSLKHELFLCILFCIRFLHFYFLSLNSLYLAIAQIDVISYCAIAYTNTGYKMKTFHCFFHYPSA